MADAATPEIPRLVQGLARAIVAAARSRALYPGEHPAVASSLDRLRSALDAAAGAQPLAIGVTPGALIVDEALVRLGTEELGVVTYEHPTDPFRPQVKIIHAEAAN